MNNYVEDHDKISEAINAVEDMTTMLEVFIENTSASIEYTPTITKVEGKWRTELKVDNHEWKS